MQSDLDSEGHPNSDKTVLALIGYVVMYMIRTIYCMYHMHFRHIMCSFDEIAPG